MKKISDKEIKDSEERQRKEAGTTFPRQFAVNNQYGRASSVIVGQMFKTTELS